MKQMNRKNESISDAKFDIGVWPEEACYMTAHRCSTWSAGMDASDTVTFHDSFSELKNFVERYNAWARFEENSWRFEVYLRGATVHYILNRDAFLAGAVAVSALPRPQIVSDVSRQSRTQVVGCDAPPASVRPYHRILSEAQTELDRLLVRIYVHPSAWDALPKNNNGLVNGGLGLGGIPRLLFANSVFRDLVRSLANSDKRVCFVRTWEHATHVIATVKAGLNPDDYPTRICAYGAPEDDRNIYMFEAACDHTKDGFYVPRTELAFEILQQIYYVHDI